MKPTAWLAIAGCLAGVILVSCGKKSEPSDIPTAPVAQVTSVVVQEDPEPSGGVTDLTPPPAEPPAEDAMPDEEEPSAPDSVAAPD